MKHFTLVALLSLFAAVSCIKEAVNVTGIKLDKEALSMKVGESSMLTATVIPADAHTQEVLWTCSDSTVAAVSNGTVKAIKYGTATVVASTACGGFTAICKVDVKENVQGIKVDQTLELYEYEERMLSAEVITPEGTSTKDGFVWECHEDSLLTVFNGMVVAKRAPMDGHPVIVTVSTKDSTFRAECKVSVKCHVSALVLEDKYYEMEPGETDTIKVTVAPSRASDKGIVFTSSNPQVATVDEKGVIKAVRGATDTVKISVTANDENPLHTATCMVSVRKTVKGICITYNGDKVDSLSLLNGSKCTLVAKVEPDDATVKGCKWISSDESVVEIDNDGEVNAVNCGSAEIRAVSSDDGDCSAVCRINVYEKISSLTLSVPKAELYENESDTLSFTVQPETAAVKSSVWTSLNELAVVKDGVVTAIKCDNSRKAKISLTVTDAAGGVITEECEIAVKCHPSSIKVSPRSLVLTLGDDGESAADLTATLSPKRTSDVSYTWSSSDPSIVEIDANGHARAKSVSPDIKTPVLLRATAKDKSAAGETLYDDCEVVVVSCVEGIRITNGDSEVKELSLNKNETKQLTAKLDPENVTCNDVIWESCNSDIASIDETGKLTAVGGGQTNIIATSREGGKSAICKVNVSVPVTSVSLYGVTSGQTINMDEGDVREDIAVKIEPDDATDKTVEWKSGDSNSVSVVAGKTDGSCSIIAIRKTDSPIKITATCGGKSLYFYVKVNCPVESVQVEEKNISLELDKTLTLKANVYPERASQSVKWVSDSPSTVSVNANTGEISALLTSSAGVKVWAISTENESIKDYTLVKVSSTSIPVTSVSISGASTVNKNSTITLSATVLPTNATNRTLRWESSSTAIATVNSNGQVTGTAAGTVTITATATDGSGKYGTHTVQVIDQAAPIPVTGVSISPTGDISLEEESTKQLTAVITPSTATDKSVSWSSDTPSVATVSSTGLVTAVAAGTAIISVTTNDGGFSARSNVTVTAAKPISVTGVSISPAGDISLEEESTKQLTAVVTPSTATDKSVSWSSDTPSVATVSSTGLVTAVAAGTAIISVTTNDGGFSARSNVTVTEKKSVEKVTLSPESLEIYTKETSSAISVTYLPSGIVPKTKIWRSSNTGVATVDSSSGKITGVSAGTANITLTADGVTSNACTVTVLKSPQIIIDGSDGRITATGLVLNVGEEYQIKAEITPPEAKDMKLVWSVSQVGDEKVKVNDGKVIGLNEGRAVVFVSIENISNTTIGTSVKVNAVAPQSLSVSRSAATMKVGEKLTLDPVFNPSNTTNKKVTWASSNASVVTVSDGVLTALAAGKAEITVTSDADKKMTAKCYITVTTGDKQGNTGEGVGFEELN